MSERHTDKKTNRQRDRQTDKQTKGYERDTRAGRDREKGW